MTDTTPAVPQGSVEAADPRFTRGLVLDVARQLETHGYPALNGAELRELHIHLFCFLHGTERGHEQCMGRAR